MFLADVHPSCPGVVQKRKLSDAAPAFPNIFLTRRVSINVKQDRGPGWQDRANNEHLELLLELLSQTKLIQEKKLTIMNMKKRPTSLALGNFSIEMTFEEGQGFEELKGRGWDIVISK
ncbi:hypothetical protein G6011_08079 [Alternaria panax]|uniref:Uncharacterized protein n=1 Tax=Alternaria panax TaxID=48097 RepID=A0AAD4FK58_9PLEO|nr:hypothetical protein G6011_08079 [Alternaria panax]